MRDQCTERVVAASQGREIKTYGCFCRVCTDLLPIGHALGAAVSVLWMAKRYAEGGGSGGPEMREYRKAVKAIEKARGAC